MLTVSGFCNIIVEWLNIVITRIIFFYQVPVSSDQKLQRKSQPKYKQISDDRREKIKKRHVKDACQLKDFVENVWKLPFKKGCVYYEIKLGTEVILHGKDVIAIKKSQLDSSSVSCY